MPRTFFSSDSLYEFDRLIEREGGVRIAGVDEAGRGPLAGPVVAAVVVLDLDRAIPGVNDSKKLSARQRERLYSRITAEAVGFGVGVATVDEIDRTNILAATLLSMRRAVDALAAPWSLLLIDGNQPLRGLPDCRMRTVVGGDGRSASIAAASIVAKVTRDRIMAEYHERFPIYDFISNKGYGTALHCRRIREHGLCEHHRRSFCGRIMAQTELDFSEP
jgi:ribonuclease HII